MLSLFHRIPNPSISASSSRYLIRFSSTNSSNSNQNSKKDSTADKEPIIEVLKGKRKPEFLDITDKEKNPSYLKKIIPDVQKSIFGGRSSQPMNWNYPNKKIEDSIVEELPLEDIVKDIPKITKKQYQLVKEEINEYFDNPWEKPDVLNHIRGLNHGEAKIEYEFKEDKRMEIWNTGCDSDWNQGFSRVEFIRTPRDTALFRGYINTEVVKCRGDGRSYKIMLYVPGSIDLTWGDSYAYPLHTHGGPYWQYEKIPFSRFLHTVGGRIQDIQKPIIRQQISSVGITLMDRIDGEFQLEIDYIGCYNDRSHLEVFAYEQYSIPMFNPQTM
uniref:NADH:ubiquinone oxidoreductase intermediate-associated protein 30 domain-containing protein n=1 Tax=Panagrolaimus sp. ES5 TaxID=591445 RepID=A0AC34F1Y4_9BILA